jgi:hypothetical protein
VCAVFLIITFLAYSQATVIIASSSTELPQHSTVTASVTESTSCTTAATTHCSIYVNISQPYGIKAGLGGKLTRYRYVVLAENTKYWADTVGYFGLVVGLVGIPPKVFFWLRRNSKSMSGLFRKQAPKSRE